MNTARAAILPVAVALVTIVCFWPVLQNDFVNWDDDTNFLKNRHYRGLGPDNLKWMFTHAHMGHYIPVTWITLGVDYLIWNMKPMGYHLTSLLLHAANAALFCLLLLALLRRAAPEAADSAVTLAAAAGALLFSIHPLRVESVAWVTERRDVLSGFFILLTLLAYLRMLDAGGRRRKWLTLSLVCFALSLLSKAWGITLPIVLLALDAFPLRRFDRKSAARLLIEKIPYAVLAIAAAIVASVAVQQSGAALTLQQFGPADRLISATYGLCFYVWKTVEPFDLSPLYLRDTYMPVARSYFILFALPVVAVAAAAVLLRKRWPAGWVAALCYAVILSPVLGLTQAGPQIAADRYSYFACMPWAALAGGLFLIRLPRRAERLMAGLMAAAILSCLGILTLRQTHVWSDSVTLWTRATELDPNNTLALTNRGAAFIERNELERAQGDLNAAIDIDTGFAEAYVHRGRVRLLRKDLHAAIADFDTAVQLNPTLPEAYLERAHARFMAEDLNGALADSTRAIALAPDEARGYLYRGNVRREQGDYSRAITDYSEAIEVAPDSYAAYKMRANARYKLKDRDGAIADLEAALRIAPPDWPERAAVERWIRQTNMGRP